MEIHAAFCCWRPAWTREWCSEECHTVGLRQTEDRLTWGTVNPDLAVQAVRLDSLVQRADAECSLMQPHAMAHAWHPP